MKSYWFCILEVDIPSGEMPNGIDSSMRIAVNTAATMLHTEAIVTNNHSGWGLSKYGADMVLFESCNERNRISEEDARRR